MKKLHAQSLSHVQLFATPWTATSQTPLSKEFSRQECWSGLLFLPPGDLPDPRIEPPSPRLVGRFFPTDLPEKVHMRRLFETIKQYEDIG